MVVVGGGCYLIMVWFGLCVLCCLYCYFVCGFIVLALSLMLRFRLVWWLMVWVYWLCDWWWWFKFFPGGYLFSLNLGCLV